LLPFFTENINGRFIQLFGLKFYLQLMKDYYYILGINKSASINEIKVAYRKLSKKFHPDMNNGDKYFEDRFKEIQEAYEVLSDSSKRKDYDWRYTNFNKNTHTNKDEELRRKEAEQKRKEEKFKREIEAFEREKSNYKNQPKETIEVNLIKLIFDSKLFKSINNAINSFREAIGKIYYTIKKTVINITDALFKLFFSPFSLVVYFLVIVMSIIYNQNLNQDKRLLIDSSNTNTLNNLWDALGSPGTIEQFKNELSTNDSTLNNLFILLDSPGTIEQFKKDLGIQPLNKINMNEEFLKAIFDNEQFADKGVSFEEFKVDINKLELQQAIFNNSNFSEKGITFKEFQKDLGLIKPQDNLLKLYNSLGGKSTGTKEQFLEFYSEPNNQLELYNFLGGEKTGKFEEFQEFYGLSPLTQSQQNDVKNNEDYLIHSIIQLKNGDSPFKSCFNTQYDKTSNAWLVVNNQTNSDVIFLLEDIITGLKIRNEFIKSKSTFKMTEIPSGTYKMMEIYGTDWSNGITNPCGMDGFFTKDVRYTKSEKADDLLNVVSNYSGYSTGTVYLEPQKYGNLESQSATQNEIFK